jgi:hypothetical protein
VGGFAAHAFKSRSRFEKLVTRRRRMLNAWAENPPTLRFLPPAVDP